MAGKKVGTVELNDELFNIEYNEALIHQIVVAQLANKRQGTKSTLTRAEVRGGGIKPYRQKGTGRARQGPFASIRKRRRRIRTEAPRLLKENQQIRKTSCIVVGSFRENPYQRSYRHR